MHTSKYEVIRDSVYTIIQRKTIYSAGDKVTKLIKKRRNSLQMKSIWLNIFQQVIAFMPACGH